jgi:TRAP-type C4-dicarboxylate transport system permease small subunit
MTIRKILAMVLCVAAVFSVMGVVAYTTQSVSAIAAQENPAAPSQQEITTQSTNDKIKGWWNDFYPKFDAFWTSWFKNVSDVLVMAFGWLLKLGGYDLWGGAISL